MLGKYRYRGRHRAPSSGGRAAARVLAAATVAAAPVAFTPAAAVAAADSVWDRLAQCESGGRWNINTGNGYSGGVQFHPRTWAAMGGGEFARYAYQATREEQIVVAERVLAAQGWNAWPACSRKLGIRSEPADQRSTPPQDAAPRVSTARSAAPQTASAGVHVVVDGDTLSAIAADHGTTWQALWDANRDVVEDANLIYPGERLAV